MAQEFIIGRAGTQPFTISDNCQGVSHRHARITIDDSGEWWIENISGPGGNGVFIKTGPDHFERVEKRKITEDTIIRLGEGTHLSYTFMAHRTIERPGDYSYEFKALRQRFKQYKQAIADLEATNKKRTKLANSIMVAFFVIAIPLALTQGVTAMVFSGLIGTISRIVFGPKTEQMKKLMALRQTEFTCPVCGMPMNDMAIKNMKCLACKSS